MQSAIKNTCRVLLETAYVIQTFAVKTFCVWRFFPQKQIILNLCNLYYINFVLFGQYSNSNTSHQYAIHTVCCLEQFLTSNQYNTLSRTDQYQYLSAGIVHANTNWVMGDLLGIVLTLNNVVYWHYKMFSHVWNVIQEATLFSEETRSQHCEQMRK